MKARYAAPSCGSLMQPCILFALSEIWYIHGGNFCDPKGWRKNTLMALGYAARDTRWAGVAVQQPGVANGPAASTPAWSLSDFAGVLCCRAIGGLLFLTFQYSSANEVRHMPPKGWIPSLMWNSNVPDPVDFRGRKLDRQGNLVAQE